MLRSPLRAVSTCFEPYYGVLRPVPIVPTTTNVWVPNDILWAPVAQLTFMLMSNIPFEVCVVIHIPPHQNDANIRVCGGGLGGWSHEETASRILYTYIYIQAYHLNLSTQMGNTAFCIIIYISIVPYQVWITYVVLIYTTILFNSAI